MECMKAQRTVDHVHGIVRRVGHVEPARALVDRRVVEAARRGVSGKLDVAGQPERHVYTVVLRWQNAYKASYIGNSHSRFW
jgi:hypothetical protein